MRDDVLSDPIGINNLNGRFSIDKFIIRLLEPENKMPTNLPEGYGAAAPKEGAAVYAKKKRRKRAARVLRQKGKVAKGSYLAFVKKYLKENKGKSIADAAKAWKAQKAA